MLYIRRCPDPVGRVQLEDQKIEGARLQLAQLSGQTPNNARFLNSFRSHKKKVYLSSMISLMIYNY